VQHKERDVAEDAHTSAMMQEYRCQVDALLAAQPVPSEADAALLHHLAREAAERVFRDMARLMPMRPLLFYNMLREVRFT